MDKRVKEITAQYLDEARSMFPDAEDVTAMASEVTSTDGTRFYVIHVVVRVSDDESEVDAS